MEDQIWVPPDRAFFASFLQEGESLLGDMEETGRCRARADKKLWRALLVKWWGLLVRGGEFAAQEVANPFRRECREETAKAVRLLDRMVEYAGLRFWDVESHYESAEELLATFQ